MRIKFALAAATVLLAAPACSFEDAKPGTASPCADPAGTLLGCPREPVQTPEEACERLLRCGVITLDNPDGGGDWPACIRAMYRLEDFRRSFVFACIRTSTCDDLQDGLCLEHANF